MAVLTWANGHVMAVVPADSKAYSKLEVTLPGPNGKQADGKAVTRDVIVLPEKGHLEAKDPSKGDSGPADPHLMVAANRTYGVLFLTVLVLVIVITNVPLRGMWSVVVIITVILMAIIFGLAGWWETILRTLSYLDIRINFGGYFFLSFAMLVIWLVTVLVFDRQMYILFTPSQMRVCTEIGGGEQLYDTTGLSLIKQRSDLFRHWILGLGSGDLIVKTSGAQSHQIDLANVLFIGRKVRMIEEMLQKRKVIDSR
jgi:hypothetical protein